MRRTRPNSSTDSGSAGRVTPHRTRAPGDRWSLRGVAVVAAAMALLTGCTGDPEVATTSTPQPPPAAPASASTDTAASPSGTGATGADPSATAPSPGATAEALPVVATRRGSDVDGAKVEVTLNSVTAEDKVMTVTWTARNAGDKDWHPYDYFFTGSFFDGPKYKGGGSGVAKLEKARAQNDADGVYVLDRANGRRYLTGRDAAGRCACSDVSALNLQPGGEAVLEALYQAPPADVTEVDVVVPNVGTFRDVPVTR